MQPDQRRAAVVAPARLLAERAGARVARQSTHAVLDCRSRLVEPSGPKCGASGFEPEQAIAWIQLLQFVNHAQRVVVPLLAVVDDDEREAGIGLDVARVGGGLFDQAQSAFTTAAEAREPGEQTKRCRKRRDTVAIEPDRESRVVPARIERQGALMLAVGASRRAKSTRQPPLDSRLVCRQEGICRADLKMRVRVVRVLAEPFVSEGERAVDVGVKRGVQVLRDWLPCGFRARLAKIVLRRHRSLTEQRIDPHRCGNEAIGGGMGRIGVDGRAECGECVFVIEVVAEVEAARAQRCGRSRSACGCR